MNNPEFYKTERGSKIWWVKTPYNIGEFLFSFDKKKVFNFFRDYPNGLTEEQRMEFIRENPELAGLKEEEAIVRKALNL